MPMMVRAALVAFVAVATLLPGSEASAQDAGFGDSSRLRGAGPVGVRAWVDWDELITERAGGATEDQFHQAILWAFEGAIEELGIETGDDAASYLLCRVETLYDSGLIAFAARVEFHEPFGSDGSTAITWHNTWLGTAPVQNMHMMFSIGEQCASDFAEAWRAQNAG